MRQLRCGLLPRLTRGGCLMCFGRELRTGGCLLTLLTPAGA